MDKNNLTKYVVLAFAIAGIFYLGFLGKKISTLEKTVSSLKVGGTDTTAGTTGQPQAKPKISLDLVKNAFNKAVIKFGDANNKVIALEISDPSCPYCQIAGGKNKELTNQSPQFKLVEDGGTYLAPVPELKKLADSGKVAYALLYTPGHGNGELGMKALYCAFELGKFWEANDLIMSGAGYDLMNNKVRNDKAQSGTVADFLASAVDKTKMKTCLDSGKYDGQLASDQAVAQGLGVSGTPGFFINAEMFAGAYSYKDMEPAVTAALK
jgi:protein-disulfide isomerase